MFLQETRSAHSRHKLNLRHIVLLILAILLVLAATITSILTIFIGILSPLCLFSSVVGLVVGGGSLIVTLRQAFAATESDIMQTRMVSPDTTPLTAIALPANIQSANFAQGTSSLSKQLIFFPNLSLPNANEFYGYNGARKALVTRTFDGGSSLIVGEHGVGKTWLLKYLQLVMPAYDKYRIAYFNAMHPDCKDITSFVQLALKAFNLQSPDPNLYPAGQFAQAMRNLRQLGLRPILCIDEFEGFMRNRQEFNDAFFGGLRVMVEEGSLVLVIASRRTLKQVLGDTTENTSSPLYGVLPPIWLRTFTEQEAREFVQKKSNAAGFTDKEKDFFFSQCTLYRTNAEPYWLPQRLQLVGRLLLDEKQDTQGQQPLEDKLNTSDYQRDFEMRLNEPIGS